MTVIDVHTHMLTLSYLDLLRERGGRKYVIKRTPAGQETVHMHDVPFFTLTEEMWDYDKRIRDMDAAGVDIAIVSLTCPSAYFGDEHTSSTAAQLVNDSMAQQMTLRPDRIRWFATLPWQFESSAVAELERALALGASGVFVSGNIDGEDLTSPRFANVWRAIDAKALPVLLHPAAPQGTLEMHLGQYGLVPPIGFTFDTSLAVTRMILDGFFDRFPSLKIIAGHGGGALPYLVGRLDRCHEMIPAASEVVSEKPSTYLRHIYYDAVLYTPEALRMCLDVGGEDHVMYGSDYPHNIGDMRGCLARTNALPAATARKVNSANAIAVFGL